LSFVYFALKLQWLYFDTRVDDSTCADHHKACSKTILYLHKYFENLSLFFNVLYLNFSKKYGQ